MTDLVGSAFEERIAENLRRANIPFVRNQAVGGLRPDFLIATKDGRELVLEAKNWKPSTHALVRASVQASFYKRATGAASAFVVVPKGMKVAPGQGVVPEDRIVIRIHKELGGKFRRPAKRAKVAKTVFCAMPFAKEYDDVYFVAMVQAAKANGAVAERIDQEEFQGDIIERMQDFIRASDAVIADLTDSNPNVLYEIGFSHALNRPTIHICSSALDRLPFDVRTWNTISYNPGQTFKLIPALRSRLRSILGR